MTVITGDDILKELDLALHMKLREPFPADRVGKLPRAGVHLDYVGHGAVTERLLDVDPTWDWTPVATDDHGLPLFDTDDKGRPTGLWIRLTVLGMTRLGYGSCAPGQFDAEKVLIGDAIRNAAMRFGVALDLWIKGHAEDDEQVAANDTRERGPRNRGSGGARQGPRLCPVCSEAITGEAQMTTQGPAHKACVAPAANPDEEPF